ncbi:hypothetical protein V8F44DRAFT_596665 [Aspergillus fumigatus]
MDGIHPNDCEITACLKYIDPDDETITIEEPIEPPIPEPARPFKELTPNERAVWRCQMMLHERAERKFERDLDGLIAVRQAILSTVSRHHWHIVKRPETVRQTIIKLRAKRKPDKMT